MTLLYQVVTKFHTKSKLQGISLHKNQIVLFKKALSSKKKCITGAFDKYKFYQIFSYIGLKLFSGNNKCRINHIQIIVFIL